MERKLVVCGRLFLKLLILPIQDVKMTFAQAYDYVWCCVCLCVGVLVCALYMCDYISILTCISMVVFCVCEETEA